LNTETWPSTQIRFLLSPRGNRLYTANGNSDDVSIVDLQAGRVTAKVRAGNLPWGIAVSPQR